MPAWVALDFALPKALRFDGQVELPRDGADELRMALSVFRR